jgi:hypothetical protein
VGKALGTNARARELVSAHHGADDDTARLDVLPRHRAFVLASGR